MESTLENGLVVKLNKDNFMATVTRSKDVKGDISIPQIIEHESDKYVISKIESYAFSQNSLLISISIPFTVRIIEESAFYKCDQLKSIEFASDPDKDSLLEEIGNFAFGDCINLEIMSPIPSSVRRIGNSSFSKCQNLKSVTIETSSKSGIPPLLEEIGNVAFYSCTNLESISIIPSTVRRIGESAFYKCTSLTSVTFGSSDESKESNLKEISKFAFADCFSLETVSKIPASVCQIGESSFANCTRLKSLSFSSYESLLEEIGNESFYNCTSLESVTFFPSNCRKIGKYAFCKCEKLKSFSFGPESTNSSASLEEIGDYAFCDCLSIEKVTSIPVTLRKISNSSFYKCGKLKLLTFGSGADAKRLNSLEEIGDESFYCCSSLELVIMIPSSVRRIGSKSFYQCHNLKLIIFDSKSSKLEEIGREAFFECEKLISVTMLPATVRTIGKGCFSKCASLKSVTFSASNEVPSLVEIPRKMFVDCSSLETVNNVPVSIRKIGKSAFSRCSKLTELTFSQNEKEGNVLCIDEICDFAFNECSSFCDMFQLPLTVRRIGKASFFKCVKLNRLCFKIASSDNSFCLDEIDDDAFYECTELETVIGLHPTLRRIGQKCFYKCKNLKKFEFIFGPSITSLSLLSEIGEKAFSGCLSLESFKSTSSVPLLIGNACFEGDERLGAVVCSGDAINVSAECFNGCKILSYVYFPNAKVVSIADMAFNDVPESFELFVPTDVELNGSGLEKVKDGVRKNKEPKNADEQNK